VSDVKVGVVIRLADAISAPLEKVAAKFQNLGGKVGKAISGANNITKVTDNINKTSAALDGASLATEKLTDATSGLVDQFGNALPGVTRKVENLSDAIKETGRESEKAANKGKKLLDGLSNLKVRSAALMRAGATAAAAGAGMLGAVTLPVMSAVSNDAAMRRLKVATMRSDGTNDLDAVEGTISSLTGYKSKLDLTEMAAGMLAAGVKADDVNGGGLKAAHDLAILGDLDSRTAGHQLAELSQNAGITDFDALKDIVVRASHASGMDMGQMMTGLTGLASQGKNLGITGEKDLADVSRVLAGLSMSGVDNGESVVSGVLSALPRLGEKLKHGKGWKSQEGANIMRSFGIGDLTGQLFDKEGNVKGDDLQSRWGNIVKVISSINTAKDAKGKGIGDKDKMVLLRELFGEDTANGLVKLDLGIMNGTITKMQEQARAEDKLAAVTDNVSGRFHAMKNSLNESMVSLGEKLLPTVNDLMARIDGIVTKLTAWTAKHPGLTRSIMVLGSALGGLMVVGGGVVTAIGSIGQAISMTGSAFTTLKKVEPTLTALKSGLLAVKGTVWSLSTALFTTPIGWILLAVAAAGLLIWKYWEPIKKLFLRVWEIFKGADPATEALMVAMSPLVGIPMLIVKHWDTIKAKFTEVWESFKKAGPIVDILLFAVSPVIAIPALLIKHWDKLPGLWDNVKAKLTGVWEAFMQAGPAVDVLVASCAPLIGIPILIVKHWDKVSDYFKGFSETFSAGWVPMGAEFKVVWDMICDVLYGVWGTVESLFGVFGGVVDIAGELFSLFGFGSSKADELTASADGVSEAVNGTSEALNLGKAVARFFLIELMKLAKVLEFLLAILQTVLATVETVFKALSMPNKVGANLIRNLKDGKGLVGSITGMFQGTGDGFAEPWKRVGNSWSKTFTPIDVKKLDKIGGVNLAASPTAKVAEAATSQDPVKVTKGKVDPTPQPIANNTSAPAHAPAAAVARKEIKGGDVTIHYEPRLEFHSGSKETDKNWFLKQLDENQAYMAKLVKEQLDAQGRWMVAQ